MTAATAGFGRWRLLLSMTADNSAGAPAASSGPDADRLVKQLYLTHYLSLVRVATLLVGDVGTAEKIVQDSFVAMYAAWRRLRDPDAALSYLRQDLVRRSRTALRRRSPAATAQAPPDKPDRAGQPGHAERFDPSGQPGHAERFDPSGQPGHPERFDPSGQPGHPERFDPLGQPGHPEQSGQERSAVLAAVRRLPNGQREALVLLLYLGLSEEQVAAAMGISRRAMQEHAARGRAALQSVL